MHLRAIALGLLLALSLGVATAAQPCAAQGRERISSATVPAACHDGKARRHSSPAKRGGCCDPWQSDPTACHQACHGIAVLRLPPALPVLGGCRELASTPAERSVSLFVTAIDHIPLA
jgi:hypothetical protein